MADNDAGPSGAQAWKQWPSRNDLVCGRTMSTGSDRSQTHIPGLDGLRGFAALCVLLSHGLSTYTVQRLHEGLGQMGVALFFVLSAYLLTRLWGGAAFDRVNIATYLVHRAARVLPLFWLSVPVYVVLYRETTWNGAVCAAAVSCAWSLWTIPVELQFYAVFLILWRDMQAGRPMRGLVCCFIAIAAIGAFMFGTGVDNIRFPMWAHFFFVGSAIAMRLPPGPSARRGAASGVAAILFFFVSIPGLRMALGLPTLENNLDPLVIASVVVLFVATLRSRPLAMGFEHGWARAAGRISFGVYVIHWPVLIVVERIGLRGVTALLLYVVVSIGLAIASARFVEAPAKRAVNRLASAFPPLRTARGARRF